MALPLDPALNATNLATALVSIGLASLVWWRRLHRLSRLRARLARLTALSEEILSSSSPAHAASLLDRRLSEILAPTRVSIFLAQPNSPTLELAAGPAAPTETITFQMLVQGKPAGSLHLSSLDSLPLHDDERAALQHLANQVAIALHLQDQRRLRDQLLRGEQLGAAGLLVSTIATELRPLLVSLASSNREQALPALETLDRLIAFGHPETAQPQTICLNQSLRHLVEFRSKSWRLRLIEPAFHLAPDPLPVFAARAPLEQAILALIIHAEQALDSLEARPLSLSTASRDGHALLTLAVPAHAQPPAESGLAPARALLEAQQGHLETRPTETHLFLELSLPLSSNITTSYQSTLPQPIRPLTLLLAHPAPAQLRPVITFLGATGHRAIPADSAAHALDLLARFRFDALFASPSLADLDWPALSQSAKLHTPATGLILPSSDGAPPAVPLITLPLDELALTRTLAALAETA